MTLKLWIIARKFIDNLLIKNRLFFFLSDKWELRLALTKLRDELFHFESCLETLFTLLYSFFPTKPKFRQNLIKTEQLFIKDIKYQFKKIIRKNGKYSSGIYGKKVFFRKN